VGKVIRRLMRSPRRLASVLLRRRVPLRTRVGLLNAEAGRRVRAKSAYAVRYGRGEIFLSHDDYATDWEVFKFVAALDGYRTDYVAAVVLDLGAHKGYYGAYAFAHGASRVVSFEPEAVNLEFLERSAATYRERGADWQVRHCAVGAERGEATLHVTSASWGHALHPPEAWSEYEVGVQPVQVEAMADILAEAESLTVGRARLIVKVNTEGEECGIVLGTPAEAWSGVSELFVDVHIPWGPCTAAELAEHLTPVGFRELPSTVPSQLRLHREAVPPFGSRGAPS
jgi:FkbM family methyltransferase